MNKNYFLRTLVTIFIATLLVSTTISTIANGNYELTANLDKTQYLQGENVQITARLTENGSGVQDVIVCYEIFDPLGGLLPGVCMPTNSEGYANFPPHPLLPDAMFGKYDVHVTCDDYQLELHLYFYVVEEYDYAAPIVEIVKPHYNMLYIFNREVLQIGFAPICIGPIDIEVNASDAQSGLKKVEIYIDDELIETYTSEPFTWKWSSIAFFQHNITAVAYDNVDHKSEDDLVVWKWF